MLLRLFREAACNVVDAVPMLIDLLQTGKRNNGEVAATLLHLGAFGLFFCGILDSFPLPIFAGSDILIAILAASRHDPWYEYAAVATAGSLIGAYIMLRIARRAGVAYLHSKFGSNRVPTILIIRDVGHRGSRRVHCRSFFPRQRVFRRCRCFRLPYPEIPHRGRTVPGRALFAHRHPCGPLWVSGNPCAPAPNSILGLAATLRRNHCGCSRHRACNK